MSLPESTAPHSVMITLSGAMLVWELVDPRRINLNHLVQHQIIEKCDQA